MVNGIDELAVTNLDGLDTVETIKVCIGYRDGGRRYDYVPNDIEVLARCQPVYAEFPGWRTPTHERAQVEGSAGQDPLLSQGAGGAERRQAGHRLGRAGPGADDHGLR